MSYNANHGGAGQQLADLKYPLHIGTALGLPGRVIILVTGLVSTVLFVTGVYTWWRKRQKSNARLRNAALAIKPLISLFR